MDFLNKIIDSKKIDYIKKNWDSDKKFKDNFGNEYAVYDGGHLKSVNGNTVEEVEHLYSNIDDDNMNPEGQEKEGQNKTALIFIGILLRVPAVRPAAVAAGRSSARWAPWPCRGPRASS